MSLYDLTPIAIGGLLVGSNLLQQRLSAAAQPYRLALAERGEIFLGHSMAPPRVKAEVRFMLDDVGFVLDHRLMSRLVLILVVLVAPFASLFLLRTGGEVEKLNAERASMAPDLRAEAVALTNLHTRVSLSTNPVLFSLALIVVAVVVGPVTVVLAAIRGSWLSGVTPALLINAIGKQGALFTRPARAAQF